MSTDRACPTAPGATVGSRRRGRERGGPQGPLALAVESFNASREAHMVAGLVRTLGEPSASIGAAAGSQTEVRITVAWELSWYQWSVDLGSEPATIRRIGSGRETSELDGAARVWNAGVAPAGELFVGRPPRAVRRRRRLGRLRLR